MSSLPSTIRGIGLHKTGDLDVIEKLDGLPFPQQKDDEILIKVTYSGVNYYDTYQRSGQVPIDSFPMVLGGDAAGTIIALPTSKGVLEDLEYKLRGFELGDNVVGLSPGSFAEYMSVPWDKLAKIPSGVDTKAAAALFAQGLTALTFAKEAYEIKKGDTILVYSAAGGVGIVLSQIALSVGATVIGTVSSEAKAKFVRDSGVQHVVVTSSQSTVDEVLRITNGKGVQAVFDGVGKDTFEDNFKLIARKGTIVAMGSASGRPPPVGSELTAKNLKYLRPTLYNYIFTPEEHRLYSAELFSLIEQGVIKPVIHSEYPFTAEGVRQSQKDITARGTIGKLLIKIA